MRQLFSPSGWVLATAVVCALAGLLLKTTEPVEPRPTPSRLARAEPDRAVTRALPAVARVPVPREKRWRAPSGPTPETAVAVEAPEAQPAVARDGAWFGAASPRPALVPVGVPRRVPAVEVVASAPAPERPVLERERRRKRHRRHGHAAAGSGPTSDQAPGDPRSPATSTPPPAVLASAPPPAATNAGAPPPDDVAVRTGDDERFSTDQQVAIPIPATDQHDGGSVSLWVQPGWAHGNKDDATLVQLGDQVRLAKNDDVLRLDTAGADDALGVPIADWNPGEWHHVAASWKGDEASLYVDGQLVGRQQGRGQVELPDDADLVVGSDHDQGRHVARGLIGRVDVRSRPLEDDEVARDYQAAVEGKGHGDQGNAPDGRDDQSARRQDGGRHDAPPGHAR